MDRKKKLWMVSATAVFVLAGTTGYMYWHNQNEIKPDCCALPPRELSEEEASAFIEETQEVFSNLDSFELEITQEFSIETETDEEDSEEENETTSSMDILVKVMRPETIYVRHQGEVDGYTTAQELYYDGQDGYVHQGEEWEETMGISSHDLSNMNRFYNLFYLLEGIEESAVVMEEDSLPYFYIEIRSQEEQEAEELAQNMYNLAMEVIWVVFDDPSEEDIQFEQFNYTLYVEEETNYPNRLIFNLSGAVREEGEEEDRFTQRIRTDFLNINEVEITEGPD